MVSCVWPTSQRYDEGFVQQGIRCVGYPGGEEDDWKHTRPAKRLHNELENGPFLDDLAILLADKISVHKLLVYQAGYFPQIKHTLW